jgi:N-acetylglucosamine malate deacetylase 2
VITARSLLDLLRAADEPIEAPIAIVVAHPDDETIGAGAQLWRMKQLVLVHLTDGAPRDPSDAHQAGFASVDGYASARPDELAAALAAGGAAPASAHRFGLPDQEAVRHLPEIVDRLAKILGDVELVLTHPYEGGHPDHDAASVAVSLAARRVGIEIVEAAGYFGRCGAMIVGEFLPADMPQATLELPDAARLRKRRMLDAFVSQRQTLAPFRDDLERFRVAPAYDFSRPPHDGPLWYERYGWPIGGAEWRRLARESGAAG